MEPDNESREIMSRGRIGRFSGPRFKPQYALYAAVALLALAAADGCFFSVSPSEVAGVRMFGRVVTAEPLGPGLHFKLPFVERVDTIQTTISKFAVNNLKVYTVDNQPITVSVNLTYQIPKPDAFHLLYDVGRAGNFDVWENIEPVIAGQVAQIFARENTVSISEDRAKLNAEITKSVQSVIGPMFGIDVRDLQITALGYGSAFEESIAQAAMAKNSAIRAENEVNQRKYEADQVRIEAEGKAQAAIAAAQGEKQAAVLRAEGQAKAKVLLGEAEAKAIQLVGAAVAANPAVVQYQMAKGWNGQTPATIITGERGAIPLLNLSPGTIAHK